MLKISAYRLCCFREYPAVRFKYDSKRKIPRKKNKVIIKILILRKFSEKILILRIRMLVNTSPGNLA